MNRKDINGLPKVVFQVFQTTCVILLGVAAFAGLKPAVSAERSFVESTKDVSDPGTTRRDRPISQVERGYTDRIVVTWKSGAATSAVRGQERAIAANPEKSPAISALSTRVGAAGVKSTVEAKVREDRVASVVRASTEVPDIHAELSHHRAMSDAADVLRFASKLSPEQFAKVRLRLLENPDVADVHADRIYFPALVPNDPCFAAAMPTTACPTSQWNLGALEGINVSPAWDITTGNASQVIAVIDTGILNHADLAGRVLQGYDFVSNSDKSRSNDGDGRDNNAIDPGDAVSAAEAASGPLAGCPVQPNSSWHGTMMAGVIAANANNGGGIAGLNWNAKILPVRAMGKCGGYESDIINGLLWAAGVPQPALSNVPGNTNAAKIINMSLTSGGVCSAPLQAAIDQAIESGATIIAAAGNLSQSADLFSPGGCKGVITVGAVRRDGGLPVYANTGGRIDVSAPGGLAAPLIDGVITTSDGGLTSSAGDSVYKTTTGTSIAAAQVSGIVSLMKAARPTLRAYSIRHLIRQAVRSFPNVANGCNTANCGRGIVDATKAVRLALGHYPGNLTEIRGDGTIHSVLTSDSGSLIASVDLDRVTDLKCAGQGHHYVAPWCFAIRDGEVWAWGGDAYGLLGAGWSMGTQDDYVHRSYADRVIGPKNIVSIDTARYFGLAMDDKGVLWGWGGCCNGIDRDYSAAGLPTLAQLPQLIGIAADDEPGQLTVGVHSDGSVRGWGGSLSGATILPISNVVEVSTASQGFQFYFRKSDGTVWKFYGPTPVPVAGDFVQVLSNARLIRGALALMADGKVWNLATEQFVAVTNPVGISRDGIVDGQGAVFDTLGVPMSGELGNQWRYLDASGENFPSHINVPIGSVRISDPLWLLNISNGATVSVASGQFQIDARDFTGANGTINHGQTLRARMTAPSTCATTSSMSVVVAGVPRQFSVTTESCDSVPDNFSFGSIVDVPFGSLQVSAPITVVGINTPAPISIAGGQYSIGCNGTFVSTASTVTAGQTVCVRLTASPTLGATVSATLTIGGVSGSFVVTSSVAAFAPQTGLAVSSLATSNAVTFSGFPNGTSISISGGLYRIGAGAFTAMAGTINSGQSVVLQLVAYGACGTTSTAVLTIGTTAFSFSVRTIECDSTATAFDFGLQTMVPVSQTRTSSAVVVSGINGPQPISIVGGQYSIGCNASFTSATGVIGNGQSVCVRMTASAQPYVETEAALTVGTTTGSFRLATIAAGFAGDIKIATYGIDNNISPGGTVFLRSDGTAWINRSFQNVGRPVRIIGLHGIVDLALESRDVLHAIRADGSLWKISVTPSGDDYAFDISQVSASVDFKRVSRHFAIDVQGNVWRLSSPLTPVAGITNAIDVSGYAILVNTGIVWSTANPTAVVNGLSNIKSVYGEDNGALLAVDRDGVVWFWGGDSNIAPVTKSQLPPALEAEGLNHTIALSRANAAWTYGVNGAGQLGDGTFSARAEPKAILASVVAIAASEGNGFAVKSDGRVLAWGTNNGGILGIGFWTIPNGCYGCYGVSTPTFVLGENDIGHFNLFQAGTRPEPVAFLPVFGAARSTNFISNSVTVSGLLPDVATTIKVDNGEISINSGPYTSIPGPVRNGDVIRVRAQSSGQYESLTSARMVMGGRGGVVASFNVFTLRNPTAVARIPKAALGNSHSLVLNPSGVVFGFGYNANGQLGNGSRFSTSVPTPIGNLSSVAQIAAGANHALALSSSGKVSVWGNGPGAYPGSGTTEFRTTPIEVAELDNVIAVSAGNEHSLALRSDSSVLAWGTNTSGQTGTGVSGASVNVPTAVSGLLGVRAVAAGGRHSLALADNGSVLAWGANESGQLGDGTQIGRPTPVLVSGLGNVTAIAACGAHSLALKRDGTLWAWGANGFGQLGDGSNQARLVPVPVSGFDRRLGQIACGENHSIALGVGGVAYTWGANANSQLGDGANITRNLPYRLSNPIGVVSVAGGGRHSAMIDAQARLYVFGDNIFGQVGNKSGNYNPQSATLNALRGDSGISSVAPGVVSLVSTGSESGSAVLRIAGLASGFDFGALSTNSSRTIEGKFSNEALNSSIENIQLSVQPANSDFNLSSNCPVQLFKSQDCAFSITFTPMLAGDRVAEVQISSNVDGSPQRLALVGTGIGPALPAANLGESFLSFVPTEIGTQSAPSSLTLRNSGNAPLVLSSITGDAPHFMANHSCGTLAPLATCNINVTFGPTAEGPIDSTLAINSNATLVQLRLSGIGVPVGFVSPPAAPVINSIAAGNGQLTVLFAPPATSGGSMISGYTVTCVGPTTVAVTAAMSPIVIGGLTNGAIYSCSVVANSTGGGSSSSGTLSATPSTMPALALTGVESRKIHATFGACAIPVDSTLAIGQQIDVEPRILGAAHQVVFKFNRAITIPGNPTAVASNSTPVGNIVASASGSEVATLLTNIPDNTRVTIALSNINGTASASASLAFLVGDISNNRFVSATDLAAIKMRINQVLSNSNCRYDLNLSGAITGADVSIAKTRSGASVP